MAPTPAHWSQGTQILRESTPDSGSYVPFAYSQDIGPPAPSADKIDISNNDSEDGVREFLIGWIEPGEVTFMLIADKAETLQADLLTDLYNRTKRRYRIVYADSQGYEEFEAYVISPPRKTDMDDAQKIEVTLAVTGKSVYSASGP